VAAHRAIELRTARAAGEQQDAADEVRAFTMAALAADLGVIPTHVLIAEWVIDESFAT
jgi:hypothetical protein